MTYTNLPLTASIQKKYQLCVDAYTGLGGFDDGSYLDKWSNEDANDIAKRIGYTEYTNQLKGVVDSLVTPVFTSIQRTNKNIIEEAFEKNCDKKGTPLTKFLEDVAIWHKLIGNVFIIMDNTNNNPERLVDAIEERKYPYIYYKIGTEVESYKTDKHGKLTEISFFYKTVKVDNKEKKIYQHIDETFTYMYSLKDGKRVLESEKVTSATNGLPVIMTGTEVFPVPAMYSLAALARLIYNKGSELRLIERTTNMNILQLVGDKPEKGEVVINNVVWIDDQASKDVKFASPDYNIMKTTLENAKSAAEDFTNIAKSYGAVPIAESAKSGIAYAYEFSGNSGFLLALSKVFREVEVRIFEMLNSFFTLQSDIQILYPNTFTPNESQLSNQLDICKDILELDISPTLNAVVSQRIAEITYVLGGIEIDESGINKINNEIVSYASINATKDELDEE